MPFIEIEYRQRKNNWNMADLHTHDYYEIYYLQKGERNIFIEDKQVYQIKKLIMQRKAKIVPAFYTKKCPTTGLIVFFIKDSLEYCGVFCSDKKTPPLRILNNLLYMKSLSDKVKLIKEHIETL